MDDEVLRLMNPGQSLPAAPAIASARRRGQPVWMWWQLLSLDAPTVAVVWALLFAHCAGESLGAGEVFALAAVVWLIYAADRVVDGMFARPGERIQERHRFYRKHTVAVCCFGFLLLISLAELFVFALGSLERQATLWLLWTVAIYFVWIRFPVPPVRPGALKGVVIGVIFAAGTVLPVWTQAGARSGPVAESALLFAFLCSLNCLAIEHWEREAELESRAGGTEPAQEGNSRRFVGYALLAAAACVFAILANPVERPYEVLFAAGGLAAALLFLIHAFRNGVSGEELRVLADAALVLPALLVLLRVG